MKTKKTSRAVYTNAQTARVIACVRKPTARTNTNRIGVQERKKRECGIIEIQSFDNKYLPARPRLKLRDLSQSQEMSSSTATSLRRLSLVQIEVPLRSEEDRRWTSTSPIPFPINL